eukprot:UN03191
MFKCSGGMASENGYNASSCTGTPVESNPVTLNGQCATMGCMGFTDKDYNDPQCSGKPTETRVNEYIYFIADKCMYNATQSCVNGEPQSKFYNNTMCSGQPMGIITAGQCNRRGHNSFMMTSTDNPCS